MGDGGASTMAQQSKVFLLLFAHKKKRLLSASTPCAWRPRRN
jgi:hypothetical protein